MIPLNSSRHNLIRLYFNNHVNRVLSSLDLLCIQYENKTYHIQFVAES